MEKFLSKLWRSFCLLFWNVQNSPCFLKTNLFKVTSVFCECKYWNLCFFLFHWSKAVLFAVFFGKADIQKKSAHTSGFLGKYFEHLIIWCSSNYLFNHGSRKCVWNISKYNYFCSVGHLGCSVGIFMEVLSFFIRILLIFFARTTAQWESSWQWINFLLHFSKAEAPVSKSPTAAPIFSKAGVRHFAFKISYANFKSFKSRRFTSQNLLRQVQFFKTGVSRLRLAYSGFNFFKVGTLLLKTSWGGFNFFKTGDSRLNFF